MGGGVEVGTIAKGGFLQVGDIDSDPREAGGRVDVKLSHTNLFQYIRNRQLAAQ